MIRLFKPRKERWHELFSAAIDGRLSEKEGAELNRILRDWPEARQELKAMQSAVSLLGQAPCPRPARSFRLTPAMVEAQKPAPVHRVPALVPLATAGAAALLAFTVAGGMVGLFEDDASSPAADQRIAAVEEAPVGSQESLAPQTALTPGADESAVTTIQSGSEGAATPPALADRGFSGPTGVTGPAGASGPTGAPVPRGTAGETGTQADQFTPSGRPEASPTDNGAAANDDLVMSDGDAPNIGNIDTGQFEKGTFSEAGGVSPELGSGDDVSVGDRIDIQISSAPTPLETDPSDFPWLPLQIAAGLALGASLAIGGRLYAKSR